MDRPTWDQHFMTAAVHASSRSIDESTHSGCVIVRPDNSIAVTGYNGPVRGEENAPQTRPEKYLHFEHAERNAFYIAAKHGISLEGCRLYVNWLPCADCARGIVQSGITEVIVHKEGQEAFNDSIGKKGGNWDESHEATLRIFGMDGAIIRNDEFVKVDSNDQIISKGMLRWWSGKLWMPTGLFSGKEYKL